MRVSAFVIALVWLGGCGAEAPTITQPASTAPSPASEAPSQTMQPSSPSLPPLATPAEGEWAVCIGAGYAIAYPAAWFVHPASVEANVRPCSLFAAQPFEGSLEEDGGWSGAQVVLFAGEGCRGSFERVLVDSEIESRIQGYPAWARDLAVGEGPNAGQPSAYEYYVNLSPEESCELGRWFTARTEVEAPGDHSENKAILDQMISSIRFDD